MKRRKTHRTNRLNRLGKKAPEHIFDIRWMNVSEREREREKESVGRLAVRHSFRCVGFACDVCVCVCVDEAQSKWLKTETVCDFWSENCRPFSRKQGFENTLGERERQIWYYKITRCVFLGCVIVVALVWKQRHKHRYIRHTHTRQLNAHSYCVSLPRFYISKSIGVWVRTCVYACLCACVCVCEWVNARGVCKNIFGALNEVEDDDDEKKGNHRTIEDQLWAIRCVCEC